MRLQRKRIAALLMAGAMLFSTLPVNALAVENPDTGGLCEHHPEHTAECGYTEGAEGTPCNHEHTEDCYALAEKCVHEHGPECYPQEGVSGNVATPPNADKAEPTECAHECSEESGCITKELDCQHEHSEDCGYTEAVPGTSCTFVCEECNAETGEPEDECICDAPCTEEAINADCPVCGADLTACEGKPEEPEQPQQITITEFDPLGEDVTNQIVTPGTDLNLPGTLGASGYVGTQDSGGAEHLTIEDVTWEPDQPYDENAQQGAWLFTAVLPEEGYTLLDGVELPEISVMAEPVNLLADAPVEYINYYWDDDAQELVREDKETEEPYTLITKDSVTTDWQAGWYVVRGEVSPGRITVNGTVHLILENNATLNAGITVNEGNRLTIYAQSEGSDMGVLKASGETTWTQAGIGGDGQSSGEITINGGNITATGGGYTSWRDHYGGAGIGGGHNGSCGKVTINGGKVEANGGNDSSGIGSGYGGSGGEIIINGGVITARERVVAYYSPGIGGGSGGTVIISGGKITTTSIYFASNTGTLEITGGFIDVTQTSDALSKSDKNNCLVIVDGNGTVYGDFTLDTDLTVESEKTLAIPENSTFSISDDATLTNEGDINNRGAISVIGTVQNDGTINNNGTLSSTGTIDNQNGTIYNAGKRPEVSGGEVIDFPEGAQLINAGSITIDDQNCSGDCKGHYIVGTGLATTNTITVESGKHDITIENINIAYDSQTYFGNAAAFGIEPGAEVKLTLKGENLLKSKSGRAGLQVPEGATLVIVEESTGSLTADNYWSTYGAGIGGGRGQSSGKITINGGTITANGGSNSAGIGGGNQGGNAGGIEINGGIVKATGNFGAGIGGGYEYSGSSGNIKITGGTIIATGGVSSAGIGNGSLHTGDNDKGSIVITGGNIEATGAYGGAGIGGGANDSGSDVRITGGTVIVNGSYNNYDNISGSGIGGGAQSSGNGTFSTTDENGDPGNAVIIVTSQNGAPTIGDRSGEAQGKWSGVIITGSAKIEGNNPDYVYIFNTGTGKVYGDTVTPTENFTIPTGATVTIDNGKTLVIDDGITMTVDGKILNGGTILKYGGIVKEENIEPNLAQHTSEVTVTFWKNGSQTTEAVYGDTITVVATMQEQTAKNRTAAPDKVEFSVGGTVLDTVDAKGQNRFFTAKKEITLTGDNWKPSETGYTITADFGGGSGLMGASGKAILKVTCDHTKNTTTTDDCTQSVQCSICNEEILPEKKEHNYENWVDNGQGQHSGTCTNTTITRGTCIQTKTEPHKGEEATCDKAQICKTCGYQMAGALGHTWGTVQYAWSDDYTSCKATRTCQTDGNHKEEATANVTSNQSKAPTCTEDGEITYTATVTLDGQGYSDTKTETLKAPGHNYGAPDYKWSEDNKTCTATHICQTDETHTETVTVNASVNQIEAPTCENAGKASYTAAFTENWASTQTETADVPATGHTWGGDDKCTVCGAEKPNVTYSVAVSATAGGSASGGGSYAKGSSVTVKADAARGYHFVKWTEGGVQVSASANYTFILDKDRTLVAVFAKNSPSSGGGSSSDDNDDAKKPTGGTETVKITPTTENGKQVVTVTIPNKKLDELTAKKVDWYYANSSLLDFGFPLETLKQLNNVSGRGDIVLKAVQTDNPAGGDRPAWYMTLAYRLNGKDTPITLSGGRAVSVKLPYTPKTGEQTALIHAITTDGTGKIVWLDSSSYDADQKAVLFSITGAGTYGVGYKTPVPVFTDISGHWAEEHILFVASRGLLNGTGNNQFSPNTGMTRGMFVTALGRLAGIDPASYQTGKFTDVKTDAYYAPYVNWAAQTGIVNGTSATTFSPDTNVTREQMAVMMKNYVDKLGYTLPATLEAVTFADNGKIGAWSAEAVKAMQRAGILAGKDNNRFDPQGTATRAEVATVLHRFVEIVIDPQAANGWTENASGTRSYYKGGKTAIGWLYDEKWYWLQNGGIPFAGGWKQIGGKWYFFNPDGTMAVNTTIDGYTLGPDGARK